MLWQGMRLSGVMSCMMLYWLVYIIVRISMTIIGYEASQSQPEFLLFILPGLCAALFNRRAALGTSLVGALIATPLCLLTFCLYFSHRYGFWQEMAYNLSAIFWCGSGALLVMLWRTFSSGAASPVELPAEDTKKPDL